MHTEGASCLKSLDHKVAGFTDFIFQEKNANESYGYFSKIGFLPSLLFGAPWWRFSSILKVTEFSALLSILYIFCWVGNP